MVPNFDDLTIFDTKDVDPGELGAFAGWWGAAPPAGVRTLCRPARYHQISFCNHEVYPHLKIGKCCAKIGSDPFLPCRARRWIAWTQIMAHVVGGEDILEYLKISLAPNLFIEATNESFVLLGGHVERSTLATCIYL